MEQDRSSVDAAQARPGSASSPVTRTTRTTGVRHQGTVTRAATAVASQSQALPGASPAATAPTGATLFEQQVDALVEPYIASNNLPGMTVAVSHQGRLILSKGYGQAKVDGPVPVPMTASMRSRIGSVTKAAVTGPAAFGLLQDKGINPETRTLYGPGGLFNGKFDADIDQGTASFPGDSGNWKQWYESITIQNLMDHKSGFVQTPNGAVASAAVMFGIAEEDLTYEQVHRWFLRTQPLLHAPGGQYSYSNHNLGLFTVIIEDVSGKSFYEYVRDDYLKPMNLHNGLQPSRDYGDSCDAYNHRYNGSDQLESYDFEASTLGMAAGGFRSSAQDLVAVTTKLVDTNTWDEIDRMGWGRATKGKLSHSGLVGGGAAYVAMFPDGYISSTGLDIGGIHVAVVTNVKATSGSLNSLSSQIVLALPGSDVDPAHDLWKKASAAISCEYTPRSLSSAQYQQIFDRASKAGYVLEWVDGYTTGGQVRFNAIFRSHRTGSVAPWAARHNMTGTSYQQHFDRYVAQGYSLTHVDSYAVGNTVRYAAIWTKNAGPFTAYHGKSAADHQASFNSLTGQGYRPQVISVASVNGQRHYTALYTKGSIGSYEARSFLTPTQYQEEFDQNTAAGRHLRYLNAYVHNGEPRFTAIWSSQPAISSWAARHGLTTNGYESQWQTNMNAGRRTQAVTGYEQGGQERFAAYWTR